MITKLYKLIRKITQRFVVPISEIRKKFIADVKLFILICPF